MKATAERMCNLTLTRTQWATLVRLLKRSKDGIAVKSRDTIAEALRADPAETVSIYREAEKWGHVVNLAYRQATAGTGEMNDLHPAVLQVSAAMNTN